MSRSPHHQRCGVLEKRSKLRGKTGLLKRCMALSNILLLIYTLLLNGLDFSATRVLTIEAFLNTKLSIEVGLAAIIWFVVRPDWLKKLARNGTYVLYMSYICINALLCLYLFVYIISII